MRSDKLFLLAAALGAATFVIALYFQYVEGLYPCKLCIWQRWALGFGILFALLAGMLKGGARFGMGGLAAAGYDAEAALAIFHSGVERKWWKGPSSCSGGRDISGSFDPAALAQALSAGSAPPRCDEIPWSFLGLSMANWNVLIALGLGLLCAYALARAMTEYLVEKAAQPRQ